jgi:hypothetical protein
MDSNREKDQGLPSCIGVYLTRIIKKMRYRKRVCREVMQELNAHLEDEMSDCDASQDKDKTAQEMITAFGDAQMLGVLMRRAKKRCRPVWKKAIIFSLQSAVILTILFICYVSSIFLGQPTIRTDYLAILNQANRAELEDMDNAWTHYDRAAQLYQRPSERISKFIRTGVGIFGDLPSFAELPKEQQRYIEASAQAKQDYWEQFDETLRDMLLEYFEQGLLPWHIDRYSLQSPEQFARANVHCILDAVIRNMIVRSRLVSDPSFESTLQRYAAPLRDMVGPAPITLPLDANDARLNLVAHVMAPPTFLSCDPDDEQDERLWQWLQQNELPDHYLDGLRAGLLRYWMEQPPQGTRGLLPGIHPFAHKALTDWLADNEMAWQEYTAGSRLSYCYRKYSTGSQSSNWLMTVLLPHLRGLRDLGRLGRWHAQLSLMQGDTASAIESSLTVIRVGRHIQKAATLNEQLIGVTLNRIGHLQLLRIASQVELSADQLQQLNQQLTALYPEGYPIMNPEFEKLVFQDTVQHVFTDGGPGGGHIVPKHFNSISLSGGLWKEREVLTTLKVGLLHARRHATTVKANGLFNRITEIRQLTPYQKQQSELSAESMVSELPQYRYALIHLMAPAVDRVFDLGYRIRTEHRGLLTVLALQRWQLQNNRYPATLDELVTAGLLAERPQDPFGAESLSYRRVGDSFTLYSFGTNLTDNNGIPAMSSDGRINMWTDNGDAVIWPLTN